MSNIPLQLQNSTVEENRSMQRDLGVFFTQKKARPDTACELDDRQLGQVYTPAKLAEFMVSLIEKDLASGTSVLDPCIGPNTFFNCLSKVDSEVLLHGIEIDKSVLDKSVKTFYNKPNRQLDIGSFFDLSLDKTYDFVIQNPPYVRQELLSSGSNSKAQLRNLDALQTLIPPTSNLYLYFLAKSILHLKEGGTMVAVIQDSWLYSSFGKTLKEIFLRLGHVDSIFHFKGKAFADADVGATVIKFCKRKSTLPTLYYSMDGLDCIGSNSAINTIPVSISREDLLTHSFGSGSLIDTSSEIFSSLQEISTSTIQRGVSSIANDYFLFEKKAFPECIPLVKNVQGIRSYRVNGHTQYVLAVGNRCSEKTEAYLSNVEANILSTQERFVSVKRNIKSGNDWYKVRLKQKGNFIFNYYLRKNIDFLYNPELHYSSDNFYSLNVDDNPLAYVAVLNSSLTRLSVLGKSRNQGSGLRKVQLYEFKDVRVVDVAKLSKRVVNALTELGKSLLEQDRYSSEHIGLLTKIDRILLKEYNKHASFKITEKMLMKEINQLIG